MDLPYDPTRLFATSLEEATYVFTDFPTSPISSAP